MARMIMKLALVAVVAFVVMSMLTVDATSSLKDDVSSVLDEPASLLSASSSSSSDAAAGGCSTENLRRIGTCQKILRSFLTSTNKQGLAVYSVPWVRLWSSQNLCTALSRDYPAISVPSCSVMATHLSEAVGNSIDKLVLLNRQFDIHDICTQLLSATTSTGANNVYMQQSEVSQCTLAATGGLTGMRCIMLHGMGVSKFNYANGGSTSSVYQYPWDGFGGQFPRYWNVHQQLDGICDVRYFVTDTVLRGWDDPSLQAEYCGAIAKFSANVVFTHSMANPTIAAAIKNRVGACAKIAQGGAAGTIQWYSTQAPWLGSPIADGAVAACLPAPAHMSVMDRIRRFAMQKGEPCEPYHKSLESMATNFKSPGAVQFGDIKATATAHLSGALCGLSAIPLNANEFFTGAGLGLLTIATVGRMITIAKWGADTSTKQTAPYTGNDGLVPFASCNLHDRAYTANPSNPWYVVLANHEDGTCIQPDVASHGAFKQPCTWVYNRVQQSRASFKLGSAKSTNIAAFAFAPNSAAPIAKLATAVKAPVVAAVKPGTTAKSPVAAKPTPGKALPKAPMLQQKTAVKPAAAAIKPQVAAAKPVAKPLMQKKKK